MSTRRGAVAILGSVDADEARGILSDEERRLRRLPYGELVARYASPQTERRTGASGATYQLEVQAFLDDPATRNLRVLMSMDDGSLRAFNPLSADFVIAPDGSFVGE